MILFIVLHAPAYSRTGTESGGGGGVVWIDSNRPVLMDFFTIIPTILNLPKSTSELASHIETATAAPLSITSENEAEITESNPAFAKSISILEQWRKMPFDSMSYLVLISLKFPLRWNYTDESLSAPPFYIAPNLPVGKKIEVVAYYSKSASAPADVWISRIIWNQMSLDNQVALLIHETLRQVQIGFGNGYNDESLQRVTSIYFLCKPTGRLNYYMFYLLNNSPKNADKIYGTFNTFIEKECKRIE